MKVAKFGGSSLASFEQVNKVVQIIKADDARRFIVVSAPGKRNANDTKVTDLLLQLYQARLEKNSPEPFVQKIMARYQEIGQPFHVDASIFSIIE